MIKRKFGKYIAWLAIACHAFEVNASSLSSGGTSLRRQRPRCINAQGWHHQGDGSFNACTRILFGMRRIPLDDGSHVYLDQVEKPQQDVLVEGKLLEEDTQTKAETQNVVGHSIALVPVPIKPMDSYVLLYLHGYNPQQAHGEILSESRLEYDRFAEQIQQSGHAKDMIALFPQSTTSMDLSKSKPRANFDLEGFLNETLARIAPSVDVRTQPMILMAHSAGGRFLNAALDLLLAKNIHMVAFFDAINGPIELSQMKDHLAAQIKKEAAFAEKESSPVEQKLHRNQHPPFYFYYSSQSAYYKNLHKQLILIIQAIKKETRTTLSAQGKHRFDRLCHKYQVIEIPKEINHSDLMRSGIVKKVLSLLPRIKTRHEQKKNGPSPPKNT